MSYQRFLAALRKTTRQWRSDSGVLRCGRHCPITMVAWAAGAKVSSANDYICSSSFLHLDRDTMYLIVYASDNKATRHPAYARLDLLRACGVT